MVLKSTGPQEKIYMNLQIQEKGHNLERKKGQSNSRRYDRCRMVRIRSLQKITAGDKQIERQRERGVLQRYNVAWFC